ncbi:MAG TPA: polyphenol oxidase family protein [Phycisphaerae bacterium]|nr:polyphenol oxidase family protein [Phycisphaerae bacterium]
MSEFGLSELANGWTVGRFAALDGIGRVTHLVTTRRGLDVQLVARDRAAAADRLARAMGLGGVAFLRQVHGEAVVEVHRAGAAGSGDALITGESSLGLMGAAADCPLILLADRQGRAVGMAHASWRGTVRRIAAKTAGRLAERYGVPAAELVACICPSAGPRRYEVGADVVEAALEGIGPQARAFFASRDGQTFFDLWSANRAQLVEAGLPPESIHVAGICTIERVDLFPSYRAEGDSAGRFAAVIARSQQG